MLQDKLLKRIWCAARDSGVDRELLHEKIQADFGKESVKDLTDAEAYYIIDTLSGKKAYKPTPKGKITEKQIWLIHKLEHELGMDDNPLRLKKFIRKYAHIDVLEWLNRWEASNIIEGLKGVLRREEGKKSNTEM